MLKSILLNKEILLGLKSRVVNLVNRQLSLKIAKEKSPLYYIKNDQNSVSICTFLTKLGEKCKFPDLKKIELLSHIGKICQIAARCPFRSRLAPDHQAGVC